MPHEIILTFNVRGLATNNDARNFALALAEHVLDTFNDDESIDPQVNFEIKRIKEV